METVIQQIPSLSGCTDIKELHKGFSDERKFVISLQDRKQLLLRIMGMEKYEAKKEEFSVLQNLKQYNVKYSEPLEFGVIEDANVCYMVLHFLEGEDAEQLLPAYTEEEQYRIGLEAGKELRKMHMYPAPPHIESWHIRQLEKCQRYIEAYKQCGTSIKNDKQIIAFIEENYQYMKHRPYVFQHDDFHPSNLIVKDKEYVGAIDFQRYDWGDPYFEFRKIALFSRGVSIPFSIGQIHGYFSGTIIPRKFWHLYSLYAAMDIFSSIVWTLKVVPHRLNHMLEKLDVILEDHDYFKKVTPSWYRHRI
jgi:aminoglycoside phosphotransferase (APT) family kinase protein